MNVKLYIFDKPISWSLTGSNFLKIEDILMRQKRENEALDKYVMIMLTTVAYSAEAYVKRVDYSCP